MKKFHKVLIALYWALIFIIIALVLLFFTNEDFQALIFREDTIYSSGYNEDNFRSVKRGMAQKKVEELLGEPIRKVEYNANNTNCSAWIYSMTNLNSRIHNYRVRIIRFDKHGLVTEKETGIYID